MTSHEAEIGRLFRQSVLNIYRVTDIQIQWQRVKIYDLTTLHNGENLPHIRRSLVKMFRVSDRQWQRDKFSFR